MLQSRSARNLLFASKRRIMPMNQPSRNPTVDLHRKSLPLFSRAGFDAAPFQKLVTPRGEICPATRHLPVPVRVVLDHARLSALSGQVSHCNRKGNPDHNPREPIFYWYQQTPVGQELYLVLYTRPCEWARCSFCTLPSESSPFDVTGEDIHLQAQSALDALTAKQLHEVRRLFLSNNGSILNTRTMPSDALLDILQLAHERFPNLAMVCLETRLETVTAPKTLLLQRCLTDWHRRYRSIGPGIRQATDPAVLQISAGYETQDPYLRNAILWKGYSEDKVQEFFAMIADIQRQSGQTVALDEYVMLKPALGLTDEEAVAEAFETICHLDCLGRYFGVRVSVRLNPTFAAVGSELFLQFTHGHYRPPSLREVFQVIERCHEHGVRLPIFIGLNDEGLTYAQSSFGNQDETDVIYRNALRGYNAHQDCASLKQEIHAEAMMAQPGAGRSRTKFDPG